MKVHGHGDPLFKAATRGDEASGVPQEAAAKVPRDTWCQEGDPLFQEFQKQHAMTGPLQGQGDPLLDEYLKVWDGEFGEEGESKRIAAHRGEERKKHGDPLLAAEEKNKIRRAIYAKLHNIDGDR